MTALRIRQEAAQAGFNILMRMNAVSRSIAAAAHSGSDLHSARSYLRTLSPTDWQRSAPPHSKMSGEDYRSIWSLLAGERG